MPLARAVNITGVCCLLGLKAGSQEVWEGGYQGKVLPPALEELPREWWHCQSCHSSGGVWATLLLMGLLQGQDDFDGCLPAESIL